MTLMRVIGDKNQISEDVHVFDFMISYLPFPQKSIRSEVAKLFFHQCTLDVVKKSTVFKLVLHFIFQLRKYPCNNTYDISFLIYNGYF